MLGVVVLGEHFVIVEHNSVYFYSDVLMEREIPRHSA